jgi:hypothetical protein
LPAFFHLCTTTDMLSPLNGADDQEAAGEATGAEDRRATMATLALINGSYALDKTVMVSTTTASAVNGLSTVSSPIVPRHMAISSDLIFTAGCGCIDDNNNGGWNNGGGWGDNNNNDCPGWLDCNQCSGWDGQCGQWSDYGKHVSSSQEN